MLKTRLINLVIIIISFILISSLTRQVWQLYKAGQNIDDVSKRLADLKIENANLQNELAKIQTPEFIEKEATDKLNLVKPGEVIVVLPNQTGNSQTEQNITKDNLANWQKWLQVVF